MKKIYTFLLAVSVTVCLFAQSPQKMSYQAVIRNSSNALVSGSPVGMRISILQGSATGTPVYVETQTTTTNVNGLVSIEIGGGTVVSGTFAAIDWSAGLHFIKTETAVTAPLTTYTITGTSQILSVPYALYSKTVESIQTSQVTDFQSGVTNNAAVLANTAKISYPSADAAKLAAITGTNTGDNSINTRYSGLITNATHTGDVTGSGALTISNNAVTLGKLQQIASNSLIGRSTSGAGTAEVITVGAGLTLSGGTLTSAGSGGSVTSVAMTAPTGLTIGGSPITTSGTLALGLTSGYLIPTTANQTNWDAGYNFRITSATGTAPLTLSLSSNQITGSVAAATTGLAGSMSAADKTKLDGIEAGAEINVNADWEAAGGDAQILNKPVIDGSETKITAGKNITVAGTGTTASPYVINSTVGGFIHYPGEPMDGGIIFYIYKGSDGLEHGLIVALTETMAQWQNSAALTNSNRSWDGTYNTGLMTDSPAKNYVTGLGAGWYLPSIDELSILWNNRYHANKALSAGGNTLLSTTSYYWSSTEYDAVRSWYYNFYIDYTPNTLTKTQSAIVRAIRAF